MKHILIIVSHGPSLINFRFHLIKNLLSKGYKVSVASPIDKFSNILQKELINLGVNIYFFKLSRTGLNLFKDFKTLLEIYKIIRNLRPNIIISFTAKVTIYSGLVLKFFKKLIYFPVITGLGFAFNNVNSIKKFILRYFILKLYKQALKSSKKVIFQNKDDQSLFFKLKIVKKNSSCIVNGSGIDLETYPLTSLPSKPVFLMISRLLVDKGVIEFFEAAKMVRSHYPHAKFRLVGGIDENPSSLNTNDLRSWVNKGDIKYLGEMKSVQSELKSCKFFVLPSYGEGLPRSILEALSTGRPIITTDVPGCRETVIHEKNGLLIPPRDSVALANAMIRLLKEKDKNIKRMAKEGFLIAKNKFEISKVNKKMLDIMSL